MKTINTYQAMQSEGILLNANESYKNIEKVVVDEIKEAITTLNFHRYPEDRSMHLVKAYANYINKKKDCIIAGNGSDEMLGLLIGLNIKEGKKLYTFSLDFSMYDYYVSMHNGEVVKYAWKMEEDFDVDDFIRVGKMNQVDMIVFSNPNNPTGRVIAQEDLLKIVEAFADIVVVIDEAYADFDETTMLDYIESYPHLFVTRTLSKAFALAGIRCGFLIAQQATIKKILPYKVPYNVNAMTQLVGSIVLKHSDLIRANIEEIKKARDHFYKQFQTLNKKEITLYPSKTNYLYGTSSRKADFMRCLQEKQIVIRDYHDDSFRITIGSTQQNQLVLDVIENF
ncbi:MAG: histidinol-phosphate aminotransferase family protein [Erysipelotrichia bacterium]|nr:histidinol-phosphate aminotransferase family protein [Erysipelotrichia bacterium]NCC54317.1 histidinol-phosphate aminotransferase family protein [Erysipelotrichia bacterium]